MNAFKRGALAAVCGVSALVAQAQPIVLYDATSNVTPNDAMFGWNYANLPLGSALVTAPSGNGFTRVNTNVDYGVYAGYGMVTPVALDATAGFRVRFDMRVVNEDHGGPLADKDGDTIADRAGLSLIILDNTARGVEIGIWGDRIFAQQEVPIFTYHNEDHMMNTSAAGTGMANLTRYDVRFDATDYFVSVNGTEVLSGAKKDYSAWVGPIDPYETPNFLFFGDDTTSARGAFDISYAELEVVPEPASFGALALGAMAFYRRRRNRR
ncbi:MAG: PEP-CTERM sorting domain-containing protein [Fimbriimonadaceae bacterium]|nr:PEP-CTERM sorting domain-containing protein [Fimbriimonadaceae bacterium]